MNEYEEIRVKLEKELTGSGRSELYTDLIKLIVKISDYIFQDEEKIQKGIGDAMGGKVLELESERLRAEGKHVARRLANLLEKRVARQLANLLAKQLAKSEEKNALVF